VLIKEWWDERLDVRTVLSLLFIINFPCFYMEIHQLQPCKVQKIRNEAP